MKDQGKIDNTSGQSLEAPDKGSSSQGVSRRNLAKAGVSAPILMTLISRPAWGLACSPSSLASGNVSGHNDGECDGQGCTPGFWKNNLMAWEGTGFSPGVCLRWHRGRCKEWNTNGATKFQDVFGFAPAIAGGTSTMVSLLDVMVDHEKSGNLGTFEGHLVAALLNAAKAPYLFGATVDQIKLLAYSVNVGIPYEGVDVSMSDLFGMLVRMNESGSCFLNAHGECAPGYVEHEGKCIPCCKGGERFDTNSGTCVLESKWNSKTHKGIEQ